MSDTTYDTPLTAEAEALLRDVEPWWPGQELRTALAAIEVAAGQRALDTVADRINAGEWDDEFRPIVKKALDAAAAAARAQADRLREALEAVRDGRDCWCYYGEAIGPHAYWCKQARAALDAGGGA